MRFSHRVVLCCAAWVLLFPRPASALWSGRGEAWQADFGGSIRTVAAGIRYYDEPLLFGEGNEYDGLSQTILRLTLAGEFGDRSSLEMHLVQDLTGTESPDGFVPAGRYRITGASWKWIAGDDWAGRVFFDRLNLKVSLPRVDVTVGRQAINFSQAYFWNPLDIFLPFDPEAFDRDYKPGVDALRVDVALGAFSGLTLVAAPGRELQVETGEEGTEISAVDFADEPWYGSALMARARTNRRGWDLALQGGKVYGGWQAGAGLSGEYRGLGLRGEATWFRPSQERSLTLDDGRETDLLEEHAAAVAGLDHRFESGFYFNVEYLYNGAGGDDLAAGMIRSAIGETLSLGRHLSGVQVSCEFHPLLTGSLSWIRSWTDSSNLFSPAFARSLSDESELVFGAILGVGSRPRAGEDGGEGSGTLDFRSEFGTYPNLFFAEIKYYF